MAKKKIAHPKRAPKRTTEKPVDAEIRRAAERAGIRASGVRATPEEWERGTAEEHSVLRREGDNTLANHVRKLVSCGLYVREEDDLTREGAMLRWSLATLRAVAIAAAHGDAGESPSELIFDGSDVAVILSGVIVMLEEGGAPGSPTSPPSASSGRSRQPSTACTERSDTREPSAH